MVCHLTYAFLLLSTYHWQKVGFECEVWETSSRCAEIVHYFTLGGPQPLTSRTCTDLQSRLKQNPEQLSRKQGDGVVPRRGSRTCETQ